MIVFFKDADGNEVRIDPEVDGPIAILLTPDDKKFISSMADHASLYCVFDEDTENPIHIARWLKRIKKKEAENVE